MAFKGGVSAARGFTLIELVIGMVVISVAFVMLSTMLFPQSDRAAQTLHRVRSAELAHSVLNEIWGKRYDQNTNANGGVPACGAVARVDLGLPAGEPCSSTLGPESGEARNDFNDVDDFNGLTINSLMLNSGIRTYADEYINYQLLVTISYFGSGMNQKLIAIDVTTPNGEVITYHAIRSNY